MMRTVAPLWLALAAAGAQTPATTFKFDFGSEKPAPGYTKVLPTTVYTDDIGYGFEPRSSVATPPFYFSVKVPEEGNYKVTVTFGDREKTSEARAWDNKLTLEFTNQYPAVSSAAWTKS
jgi:hypothetical protein